MDAGHEKAFLDLLYRYGTFTRASPDRMKEACTFSALNKGDLVSVKDKPDTHKYFLPDVHAYRYIYNEDGA